MKRCPAQSGFALLDALLALAIFGVITGMFIQTVNSTALARRHAALSRQAIMVAQSHLALAQEVDGLTQSGREGDFTWRSEITPYPGASNSQGLERVTILVSYAETGGTVASLSSLRLAR